MTEPPQLAPLDVEEKRLYSELLPDGRAPHPISKGVPGHPAEEAHFSRLYPRSRSFGHDPKFITIGEGRNVDQPEVYMKLEGRPTGFLQADDPEKRLVPYLGLQIPLKFRLKPLVQFSGWEVTGDTGWARC
ncbi:hypothetical protein AMECASPLE_013917 [Ameca splendens]|uniref:Uncharacterized protein n=1 Tax=Ameca splendens TaxID=208324 RepID=A0ABV0Y1V9_9TELE